MHRLAPLLRTKEVFGFVLLVGLVAVVALIEPSFLNPLSVRQMAKDMSFLALLAIGETFVIITAGIDLSVGSMVSLSGVLLAWLMISLGIPVWPAALIVLGIAALIGVYHGVLVSYVRVSPFIVTLGTMGMAAGAARRITRDVPISGIPDSFKFLANGQISGIPVPFLILVVVAAVAIFFANFTIYGRYLYSLGGTREATRLSGVNVRKMEIAAYVAGALLATMTGLLYAARAGQGDPTSGVMLELDAITAAVVGGCSLMGGVGSVLGAVFGAAIIIVLRQGLIFLDFRSESHMIVIGAVLVTAVTVDTWRQRRRR